LVLAFINQHARTHRNRPFGVFEFCPRAASEILKKVPRINAFNLSGIIGWRSTSEAEASSQVNAFSSKL
jgi:hypothetical protein